MLGMHVAGQTILVPPIWAAARVFAWDSKAAIAIAACAVDWKDWLIYAGLSFSLTVPPAINVSDRSLSVELGEWQDGVVNLTIDGGMPGTTSIVQVIVTLSDGTRRDIQISQPIDAQAGTAGTLLPGETGAYFLLSSPQSLNSLPVMAAGAGILPIVQVTASDGTISMGVSPISEDGGAASVIIPQTTPSSVWVLTHGLNKYPAITIVDSSGNEVEGAIVFNSTDQATVTFSAPFSGVACLT